MADRYAAATPVITGSLVTTAETALVTSAPVTSARAGQSVTIVGSASVTAGTATTSFTFRVRTGTGVSGTQIGDAVVVTAVAGETNPVSLTWVDTPGEIAGRVYTLTCTQAAATGNGTIVHATIETHIDT